MVAAVASAMAGAKADETGEVWLSDPTEINLPLFLTWLEGAVSRTRIPYLLFITNKYTICDTVSLVSLSNKCLVSSQSSHELVPAGVHTLIA